MVGLDSTHPLSLQVEPLASLTGLYHETVVLFLGAIAPAVPSSQLRRRVVPQFLGPNAKMHAMHGHCMLLS